MKLIFQERVLNIIKEGKYRADIEQGCVYSYRKEVDSWDRVKGAMHHGKYRQLELFTGWKTPKKITVYEHYVIYLAANGPFDPKMKVAWKDNDTTNNKAWNLFLTPRKDPDNPRNNRMTMDEWMKKRRVITDDDIEVIKKMLAEGETSRVKMAEAIQKDVRTVRNVVHRMLNRKPPITAAMKKAAKRRRFRFYLTGETEENRIARLAKSYGFDPRIPAEDQKHLIPKK